MERMIIAFMNKWNNMEHWLDTNRDKGAKVIAPILTVLFGIIGIFFLFKTDARL